MKKIPTAYYQTGCLLLWLLLTFAARAQPVKGRITNERNEPVAATIVLKGGTAISATDSTGHFEFTSLPANSVLLVTGVNINPLEVPVKGKNWLAIKATTRVSRNEEVVIEASTGYQTLKPNETNGSVAVIDNKTLNRQTGTNILQRLNGVSSGLLFNIGKSNPNPQNKTNISIRGLSTINGPLDPLIVVDGFIYEGDIANINPNDVESVTLLKDAAAASLWGTRAGNGVIVITTKKGKLNQPMQVNVTAGVIVQEKPNLWALPQMSSKDYVDVEEMLFNDGYFDNRINYQPYSSLTPAVSILLAEKNGTITADDATAQLDKLRNTDARNQYLQYIYQRAVTQQYSIGLRGGGNSNAYTFSAAYDKSSSELRGLYEKLNIRAGNIFQPVKGLRLETDVYYTASRSVTGMQPYGIVKPGERNVPYYSIAGESGQALPVATVLNPAFTDTLGGGLLMDWKYYPLEDYKHDRTKANLQELYTRAGLSYIISSSLSAEVKYQYQVQSSQSERLADISSYAARNAINTFSQLNREAGTVNYIVAPGGIRSLLTANINSYTLRGQLNFKKTAGDHSVNAIAGAEQRQVRTNSNGYTVYGYNEDPLSVAATDFVNGYPDLLYGWNRNISGQPTASRTVNRFVSVYANAAYSYKERYTFSTSARRDGSNIFGARTNDRWKPLWSVGAGWKISAEPFYHNSIVELLRLKVSYGYSGNVDLSRSANPVAAYVGNESFTNYPFYRIQTLNNPDLRWEQSRQFNIGVEFVLKNKRLSGSVDWYRKDGIDLLGEALFDYTAAGFSPTVVKNVANSKGTGVDIILNSRNIDKAFQWTSTLLLSFNKTITAKYFSPYANKAHVLIGGGGSIIPVVGKDLYGIAAYRWGGLDAQGNPQGYANGQLSTDYTAISNEAGEKELDGSSIVYIGPGTPKCFGSLINTISYKQLSLSFNLAYKLGYYAFKPSISYDALIFYGGGHSDFAKRWQQPGDEANTTVPAFNYPNDYSRDLFYSLSEVNVINASHIRLQYINLSWVPVIKTGTVKAMELYANVANLGIVWRSNKQGIDPDYPATVPPARIWSMGVRCSF